MYGKTKKKWSKAIGCDRSSMGDKVKSLISKRWAENKAEMNIARDQWSDKVFVLQTFNRSRPFVRIKLQNCREQLNTGGGQILGHLIGKRRCYVRRVFGVERMRDNCIGGPNRDGRSAEFSEGGGRNIRLDRAIKLKKKHFLRQHFLKNSLKNDAQLLRLRIPSEERVARVQLRQNATGGPKIDRSTVLALEQQLRATVPQGDHLGGEGGMQTVVPRQSEIGDLKTER